MIWQPLHMDSIPEVRAHPANRQAKDTIVVCDVGGFHNAAAPFVTNWGNEHRAHHEKMRTGDQSLVPLSDKYLEKAEQHMFLSRTWGARDGVIGCLPIIPAFLAGSPDSLRRRVRLKKPTGPLAIFLELTGSARLSDDQRLERGAAMLALTRVLHRVRPVELFVCVTYGYTNKLNAIVCHIETAPLDIGRAAAMLGETGLSACGFGVSLLSRLDESGHAGSWAYGSPDLERRHSGEIFKRIMHPSADLLFVPAMFGLDANSHNPDKWLRDMLVKYGGETVDKDESEIEVADTGHVEQRRA